MLVMRQQFLLSEATPKAVMVKLVRRLVEMDAWVERELKHPVMAHPGDERESGQQPKESSGYIHRRRGSDLIPSVGEYPLSVN